MLQEIIKGFLVGLCASAPLGPVAILVLQKSLGKGRRAGFVTGLGATLIDTLYAVIAIFALAFAEEFIGSHRTIILIAGGLVLAAVGFTMAFRDPFRKLSPDQEQSYSIKDFLQAIAMDLSNPGAVAVMFALFAFFGIKLEYNDFRVAPVIIAVSAGSVTYWFFFSWLFSSLRRSFKMSLMVWLNRISGIIVMIIGIALLAEGLMKVLFL